MCTQDANGNYGRFAFDAEGNLKFKGDYASFYTYGSSARSTGNAGPNAIASVTKLDTSTVSFNYDNAGNLLSGDGLNITYDGNHHTKTVSRDGATLTFKYDANGNRYEQVNVKPNETITTRYIGSYEHVITTGTSSSDIGRSYIGGHTVSDRATTPSINLPAL